MFWAFSIHTDVLPLLLYHQIMNFSLLSVLRIFPWISSCVGTSHGDAQNIKYYGSAVDFF